MLNPHYERLSPRPSASLSPPLNPPAPPPPLPPLLLPPSSSLFPSNPDLHSFISTYRLPPLPPSQPDPPIDLTVPLSPLSPNPLRMYSPSRHPPTRPLSPLIPSLPPVQPASSSPPSPPPTLSSHSSDRHMPSGDPWFFLPAHALATPSPSYQSAFAPAGDRRAGVSRTMVLPPPSQVRRPRVGQGGGGEGSAGMDVEPSDMSASTALNNLFPRPLMPHSSVHVHPPNPRLQRPEREMDRPNRPMTNPFRAGPLQVPPHLITPPVPSSVVSASSSSSAVAAPPALELGYDPSLFVEPAAESKELEELTCVICSHIVRHPLNLPCGDLFCQACLERAHAHRRVCPSCKQAFVLAELQPNYTIIKKVWGFKVRCPKHVDGCGAEYVIGVNDRNVHAHALKCQHVQVQCGFCNESMPKHRLDQHVQDSVGQHLLLLHEKTKSQGDELREQHRLTAELRRQLDKQDVRARVDRDMFREEMKKWTRKEQRKVEERMSKRLSKQSDALLQVLKKVSATQDGFFVHHFAGVDGSAGSNDSVWYSPPFVVRGRSHILRLVKSIQPDELVNMDGESIARHVLSLSLLYTGRVTDDLLDLSDEKGGTEEKKKEGGNTNDISSSSNPPLGSSARAASPEQQAGESGRFSWRPSESSTYLSYLMNHRTQPPGRGGGDSRAGWDGSWGNHRGGGEQVRPRLVRFDDDVDIIAHTTTPPPPTDSASHGGGGPTNPSSSTTSAVAGRWSFPDSPQSDDGHEKVRVRLFVYANQPRMQQQQQQHRYLPSTQPDAAEFSHSESAQLPAVIFSSTALLTYHSHPHPFSSAWDSVSYLSKVQTEEVPVADSEGDGGRGWIDPERKTVTAAVMIEEVEGEGKGERGVGGTGRGEYLLVSQQYVLRKGRGGVGGEYEEGERGAGAGAAGGAHRLGMMMEDSMSAAEGKPLQQQQPIQLSNSKRRRMDD